MKITLDHTENIAKNIQTFWFKPDEPVRYNAGQFIELTLPHDNPDDRGIKRWFTLSSSPTEPLISITTKHAENIVSSFKQKLFSLEPGADLRMSEPMGDFVLPKDMLRPLVFVAGGIGITPIRSMIKWLYDTQQHRTIHLLYAAQTVDDLAFRKLFNDYGLPTDLVLQSPPHKWEEYSGQLDGNQVLELTPDVDDKLYYLSGPEPMVETLEKELIDLGVDKQRIVGDFFPNYTSI